MLSEVLDASCTEWYLLFANNANLYCFTLDDEVTHDILASHPLLYVLKYFCLAVAHDIFAVLCSDIIYLMNIVQVTLLWDELGVDEMWSILLESLDRKLTE